MGRLVLINSFGPMASSVLAALTEKLGYTNVPVRKLGLSQYVMGEVDINSGLMQSRLEDSIKEHSQLRLSGGVSVLDRDNQAPKALANIDLVRGELEQYKNEKFQSIEDLYFRGSEIYCCAVTYKKIESNPRWKAELTVDMHRYNPELLYKNFEQHFSNVKMIHLSRSFESWINSLASQAFSHNSIKNQIQFYPHKRYEDLKLYDECMKRMSGLNLGFDDLFSMPIEELAAQLADFLETPLPDVDFRKLDYDLYGKFQPYSVAFKKFDDKITFLSVENLNYLKGQAKQGSLSRPFNAFLAWVLYILDLFSWKLWRKAKLTS